MQYGSKVMAGLARGICISSLVATSCRWNLKSVSGRERMENNGIVGMSKAERRLD